MATAWSKNRSAHAIERYLRDDLVRGLVFTDAKIGVFTQPHDTSLLQNRCFLYHLIGNKTGEWKVPVGGMGAVAPELERGSAQSRRDNADRMFKSRRSNVHRKNATVEFRANEKEETVQARFFLVNFGRNVLAKYTGRVLSAGSDGRRVRFQDQHAVEPFTEVEGKKASAS